MTVFFPFIEYWPVYVGFSLFVTLLLLLDLGVFHRKAHEVTVREASIWTGIWITLALTFNYLFYRYSLWKFSNDPRFETIPGFNAEEAASRLGLEFLTGFVVEKTLAIDNIFVFAVVFSYFAIPRIYQHRILFYGILGALGFRAIFIALGSYLMAIHALVVFFGCLLIVTGVKMLVASGAKISPESNWIIRVLRRFLRVTPTLEGQRFFVRKEGLLYATPLFLTLVFVELSDVIFAVDSVPAIFALTSEPFIVFTSNIFAILGLRSMYFLLAGVMERFAYIKYGLASVLIFVGLKMAWLNEAFGGKFPISWSLGIICGLVAASILYSVWKAWTERDATSRDQLESA